MGSSSVESFVSAEEALSSEVCVCVTCHEGPAFRAAAAATASASSPSLSPSSSSPSPSSSASSEVCVCDVCHEGAAPAAAAALASSVLSSAASSSASSVVCVCTECYERAERFSAVCVCVCCQEGAAAGAVDVAALAASVAQAPPAPEVCVCVSCLEAPAGPASMVCVCPAGGAPRSDTHFASALSSVASAPFASAAPSGPSVEVGGGQAALDVPSVASAFAGTLRGSANERPESQGARSCRDGVCVCVCCAEGAGLVPRPPSADAQRPVSPCSRDGPCPDAGDVPPAGAQFSGTGVCLCICCGEAAQTTLAFASKDPSVASRAAAVTGGQVVSVGPSAASARIPSAAPSGPSVEVASHVPSAPTGPAALDVLSGASALAGTSAGAGAPESQGARVGEDGVCVCVCCAEGAGLGPRPLSATVERPVSPCVHYLPCADAGDVPPAGSAQLTGAGAGAGVCACICCEEAERPTGAGKEPSALHVSAAGGDEGLCVCDLGPPDQDLEAARAALAAAEAAARAGAGAEQQAAQFAEAARGLLKAARAAAARAHEERQALQRLRAELAELSSHEDYLRRAEGGEAACADSVCPEGGWPPAGGPAGPAPAPAPTPWWELTMEDYLRGGRGSGETLPKREPCSGRADCACPGCAGLARGPQASDELHAWARARLAATDDLPRRLRALRERALQCDLQCQRLLQARTGGGVAAATTESRACQCEGVGAGAGVEPCVCPAPAAAIASVPTAVPTSAPTSTPTAAKHDKCVAACPLYAHSQCQCPDEHVCPECLPQREVALAGAEEQQEEEEEVVELECISVDCAEAAALMAEVVTLRKEREQVAARLAEADTLEAALLDTVERLAAAEAAAAEAGALRDRVALLERELGGKGAGPPGEREWRRLQEERDQLLRIKSQLEGAVADQEEEIGRLTALLDRLASRRASQAGEASERERRLQQELGAARAEAAQLRAQAAEVAELESMAECLQTRMDAAADHLADMVDAEEAHADDQLAFLSGQLAAEKARSEELGARLRALEGRAASDASVAACMLPPEAEAALEEAARLRLQLQDALRERDDLRRQCDAAAASGALPAKASAASATGRCSLCGGDCPADAPALSPAEAQARLRAILLAAECLAKTVLYDAAVAAKTGGVEESKHLQSLVSILTEHERKIASDRGKVDPEAQSQSAPCDAVLVKMMEEEISNLKNEIQALRKSPKQNKVLDESIEDLEDMIKQLREDNVRLDEHVSGQPLVTGSAGPSRAAGAGADMDECEEVAVLRRERDRLSAALQQLYKELTELHHEKELGEEELEDLLQANNELREQIAVLRQKLIGSDDD